MGRDDAEFQKLYGNKVIDDNATELERFVSRNVREYSKVSLEIGTLTDRAKRQPLSIAAIELLSMEIPSNALYLDANYGNKKIIVPLVNPGRIPPGTTADRYLDIMEKLIKTDDTPKEPKI